MTSREEALTKLDLKKIDENGRYVDVEHTLITYLTYEDIMFLRKHHNNKKIAYNYEFKQVKPLEPANLRVPGQIQRTKTPRVQVEVEQTKTATPKKSVASNQPTKKKIQPKKKATDLKLTREDKYTGGHHKGISFSGRRVAAVAGVIIICLAFIHQYSKSSFTTIPANPEYGIESTITGNVAGEDITVSTAPTTPETNPDIDEGTQVRTVIQEAARIYQIAPDDLFHVIASNTDNFTSDEYIEGYTFEGVSYKGSGQVQCDSAIEMAILVARAMDQDPGRFGLDRSNIKQTTNDKTPVTYDNLRDMIGYYCEIFDEDPCLIYAIVQSETGWDSRLLNELYNPAGLKDSNGGWWEFETIESGIVELILQVKTYLRDVDLTALNTEQIVTLIRNKHCPLDDPEDKTGKNSYWKNNVIEIMNEAQNIYGTSRYIGTAHRH